MKGNSLYTYCNNSVCINVDILGKYALQEKNYRYVMFTVYKESEGSIDISK